MVNKRCGHMELRYLGMLYDLAPYGIRFATAGDERQAKH